MSRGLGALKSTVLELALVGGVLASAHSLDRASTPTAAASSAVPGDQATLPVKLTTRDAACGTDTIGCLVAADATSPPDGVPVITEYPVLPAGSNPFKIIT